MASGIKLPTTVRNGRLEIVSGNSYIRQLVETSLGGSESENPFQDLGLGEFMLFDINDEFLEGKIQQRVASAFATLERDQLARLRSVRFSRLNSTLRMFIEYDDLETGIRTELDLDVVG